ncbi:hypothetical protein RGUI_2781 [Rhodovulum sp. P5]|uniref:glycine-rich domain-containing protein n=1 Tax=Rhodovulum sp. P5 TaxID=1564506 RepID=UPI0009C23BE0|nr:sialate O-acetylesterase [Rhodovulum sp. P5]ARE40922.1 hypothetical protein RGUI_2781 [Rhodovulum sp. P5]
MKVGGRFAGGGGEEPLVTGTGPSINAALLGTGVALSGPVTWGSYTAAHGGTLTGAVQEMQIDGGGWVAYVGTTTYTLGQTVEVRETLGFVGAPDYSLTRRASGVRDEVPTLAIPDQSFAYGQAVSIDLAALAGGTNLRDWTYSGPSWLTLSGSTLAGVAPSADVSTSATVTVSNSEGTVADTFAINVQDIVLVAALAEFNVSSGSPVTSSDDDFDYLSFTSAGAIEVTKAGYVDAELIGPGGSGGAKRYARSGGGGAGEIVRSVVWLDAGVYTIDPGDGGTAGYDPGDGSDNTEPVQSAATTAFGLTALSGGIGGSAVLDNGGPGPAAGGGAQGTGSDYEIGSIAGYGGGTSAGSQAAGGGGGWSASGESSSGDQGGDAGAGFYTDFLGVGEWVCEGGAGATNVGIAATAPQGIGGVGAIKNGSGPTAGGIGSGGGGAAITASAGYSGRGGAGRVAIRTPKDTTIGAIGIAEPASRNKPYPLNLTRTHAAVPFAGTTALPDGAVIQARVVDAEGTIVLDWHDAAIASGNAFSATIQVPAHRHACHFEARKKGSAISWRQVQEWFTALCIAYYGQSNAVRVGSNTGGSYAMPYPAMYVYDSEGEDAGGDAVVASVFGPNEDGRGVSALVDELTALTNVPVAVAVFGRGATSITQIRSGFDTFTSLTKGIDEIGGFLHAIIIHHGEADQASMTMPTYAGHFDGLHGDIASYTGQAKSDVPVFFSSLTGVTATSTTWPAFRQDQQDTLPGLGSNWHFVAPWDDATRIDQYHATVESYERRCRREARALAAFWGYVSALSTFQVSSAVANDTTTTTLTLSHDLGDDVALVAITHGATDNVTTAGSLTGAFQVSEDGGATWVAATAVRTDANTVTLTHAAVSTTGRTFSYNYNETIDEAVRDNSGYAWPLGLVYNMAVS